MADDRRDPQSRVAERHTITNLAPIVLWETSLRPDPTIASAPVPPERLNGP